MSKPGSGAIRAGISLLTKRERLGLNGLIVAVILSAALDFAAILSIIPVVTLAVDQDAEMNLGPLSDMVAWLDIGREHTIPLIMIVGALIITSGIINLTLAYAIQRFGAAASARLGKELMTQALRAPYTWHVNRNSAVLVRMFFGDVQLWGQDFLQVIVMSFQTLVVVAFSVVTLMLAAPLGAVGAIFITGVVAIAILVFMRKRIRFYADEQRRLSDLVVVWSTQCFRGLKDIKLSSRMNHFIDGYYSAYWDFARRKCTLTVLRRAPPVVLVLAGQVSLLAITGFLIFAEADPAQLSAIMALLVLVSSRLVPAFSRFAGEIGNLWAALPFIERLLLLKASLDAVSDFDERRAVIKPLDWRQFELKDVSFSYLENENPAVRNAHVRLERGQIYGIIGRSGGGKSTFVDLLLGLLKPQTGELLVDGVPLDTENGDAWRKGVGYVPQTPFMADASVRENVAFGIAEDEIDDARIEKVLEIAGAGTFVQALPKGLYTRMGDHSGRISGGQRQRITIARALYDAPTLLVMDEATSALDSITETNVLKQLRSECPDMTQIVVSHRVNSLRACYQILVFENGSIVAQDSFENLRANSPIFQSLLEGTERDPTGETITTIDTIVDPDDPRSSF